MRANLQRHDRGVHHAHVRRIEDPKLGIDNTYTAQGQSVTYVAFKSNISKKAKRTTEAPLHHRRGTDGMRHGYVFTLYPRCPGCISATLSIIRHGASRYRFASTYRAVREIQLETDDA
jgi:hypothetical protein